MTCPAPLTLPLITLPRGGRLRGIGAARPSQAFYLGLTGGETFGVLDDGIPNKGQTFPPIPPFNPTTLVPNRTIFDLVEAKYPCWPGGPWRNYAESYAGGLGRGVSLDLRNVPLTFAAGATS